MRNPDDVFAALARSAFRRRFRLGTVERTYLRDKGLATILEHARDFIGRRLAPAEPVNDGRQTPWRGHPVFVAQHATATCCRTCLQKWHGVAKGHALTPEERAHVIAVIARWLEAQEPKRLTACRTRCGKTLVGGREVTEGNRGRFPSVRGRPGPSRRRAPPSALRRASAGSRWKKRRAIRRSDEQTSGGLAPLQHRRQCTSA